MTIAMAAVLFPLGSMPAGDLLQFLVSLVIAIKSYLYGIHSSNKRLESLHKYLYIFCGILLQLTWRLRRSLLKPVCTLFPYDLSSTSQSY